MRLVSSGQAPRHPLWSKQAFLEELEKRRGQNGLVKTVCSLYVEDPEENPEGWRLYYQDQHIWRKADPEYNRKVKAIVSETWVDRKVGRPTFEEEDPEWREKYCKVLLENHNNRAKAADATPYTLGGILAKLDRTDSAYDERFARMVEETEAILSSEFEEQLLQLREPQNFDTFENAKISQTKAWYYSKVMEKLDWKRWGRREQINVTGRVDVNHRHDRYLPAETRLALLVDEQKKYLESRRVALGLPANAGEVVTVEVIPDTEVKESLTSG